MKYFWGTLVFYSLNTYALPQALPIPRSQNEKFFSEGSFVGGSYGPSNIEGIRFSAHVNEGYERWVIDFSDPRSKKPTTAPRFQIRYIKGSKVEIDGTVTSTEIPPKFVLTFQAIKHSYLKKSQLLRLIKKSHFIKDIVLYPPIENGDLALELLLHDKIVFDVHQPIENEGRLVIDLKNAPL